MSDSDGAAKAEGASGGTDEMAAAGAAGQEGAIDLGAAPHASEEIDVKKPDWS